MTMVSKGMIDFAEKELTSIVMLLTNITEKTGQISGNILNANDWKCGSHA